MKILRKKTIDSTQTFQKVMTNIDVRTTDAWIK